MRASRGLGLLLALLASLQLWGGGGARAAAASYGFDYLLLARQWGPTFCASRSCSTTTYNLFTIHGLWPNNRNGSHPEFCDRSNRFQTLPSSLAGPMACTWRSFTGSNEGFWSYQWDKHGACTLPLLQNQTGFFGTALALNSQYDINEALYQGGINPLAATSVTQAQLAGILEQQWNVSVGVTCASRNVFEVHTCFDTSLKVMDCPAPRSCPSGALDMPYGGGIPAPCLTYYQDIPASGNANTPRPPPPPPPRQTAPPPPSAGLAAATSAPALLLLAAAAAAAAVF